MEKAVDAKIGVFDSGVGGLTVYRELSLALPGESFIYLGDTARVPYGIRSAETIRKYALQNCLFLIERGAEAIVVACNTATAAALPFLKSVLRVPVLGVIEPGAVTALQATRNGRVGVIGTDATVKSGVYENELKSRRPDVFCLSRATPLFVPLVEEMMLDEEVLFPVFDRYLRPFRDEGVDTLILGCTHYPILKEALDSYFAGKIRLVDSAAATAAAVRDFLARDNSKRETRSAKRETRIFVTDAPERVGRIAGKILGDRDVAIEKVEI